MRSRRNNKNFDCFLTKYYIINGVQSKKSNYNTNYSSIKRYITLSLWNIVVIQLLLLFILASGMNIYVINLC